MWSKIAQETSLASVNRRKKDQKVQIVFEMKEKSIKKAQWFWTNYNLINFDYFRTKQTI